jgi:hypothetical protein
MIIAANEDRGTVIEALSKAFDNTQSVNYIIIQGKKRLSHIIALMAYPFDACQLLGELWLCQYKKACLLILYPGCKKTTLKTLWLEVRVLLQTVGFKGITRALKREKLIAVNNHRARSCTCGS